MCRNLYRTKSIHGRRLFFVVVRRKLLSNHTDYFENLVVNMLHRKIRVYDGFGDSKTVTSTQDKKEDKEHAKPPTKFEDVELQRFLHENVSQTQKQFGDQLGVNQQAVSNATRDGKDSVDR